MIDKGIRRWMPPVLVTWLRRRLGRGIRFSGRYSSWAEAARDGTGYDAGTILERVTQATREVVAGRAAYERDSVLFEKAAYPFPLIAGLLRVALENKGCLQVVDFGGALGSTYRQCRPLLEGLAEVRWHVVEQAHFVRAGQAEFTTDELAFYASSDELPPLAPGALVLVSGVIQYLEDADAVLDSLMRLRVRNFILDRTPTTTASQDRIALQRVPSSIYDAAYPCRVFSRQRLLDRFALDWVCLASFDALDGQYETDDGLPFQFEGFLFSRKTERP